jgi:hypothetical protein
VLGPRPEHGPWKLNEAKSKFAKGAQKNHTVVYELSGDMVKVTVDGTTAVGNAAHNEWTESLMANTMRSLMIRHPVRVHTEESTAAHVDKGKERQ